MKRLALYVFWEKNGMVRNHILFYISGLKEVAQDIVFIANGELNNEGRQKLEEQGVHILQRKNVGFDFSAWKEAFYGFSPEQLAKYDEIILCNCSCYGPIFPFSECFQKMEEKSCDFWGLYRHPAIEGLYPAHLQSYFLVLRHKLITSETLQEYWKKLSLAHNWEEAVLQETQFTKYFEDRGFSSLSYVDESKYLPLISNPSVLLPCMLTKEDRFPLLKRKAFTENFEIFFSAGNTAQSKDILDFIREETAFPVDHIEEDLTAIMQGSALRRILHDVVIFSEKQKESLLGNASCALIAFSYFEDMVETCIQYMKRMPKGSAIYVVVISEHLYNYWLSRAEEFSDYKFEVRRQQNRGRNESAYWLTCRDVIESYDVICVAHDKKTPSAKPGIKGWHFNRHCWDSILKSRGYVQRVIDCFIASPQLGLLMPPPPLFSDWANIIPANEWGKNRSVAKELYERLQLSIPFDEAPDAPYGAMFWLRGKAMKPFYRYPWTFEDFPEEPLSDSDGTVLHALERMYPMIAQDAGYRSAWIMSISQGAIQFDNMHFSLVQHKRKLLGLDKLSSKYVMKILVRFLKNKLRKLFRMKG